MKNAILTVLLTLTLSNFALANPEIGPRWEREVQNTDAPKIATSKKCIECECDEDEKSGETQKETVKQPSGPSNPER